MSPNKSLQVTCTVLMDITYLSEGQLIQKAQYYGAEMDDRSIWVGGANQTLAKILFFKA